MIHSEIADLKKSSEPASSNPCKRETCPANGGMTVEFAVSISFRTSLVSRDLALSVLLGSGEKSKTVKMTFIRMKGNKGLSVKVQNI